MSRSASSKCRNLRDVRRDPARVVTREQFGGGPSTGFLLEINVCQRLSVVVAHDEARLGFFGRPGWRKTSRAGHYVLPVNSRATKRITKAPGTTGSNANC